MIIDIIHCIVHLKWKHKITILLKKISISWNLFHNPTSANKSKQTMKPSDRFTWAGKAYWATAGSFSISSIQRVRTGTLSTGNTKSGSFWKIKTQFRSWGFTFDFYLINTSITGDPLEPRPQHVIQPWLNIFEYFIILLLFSNLTSQAKIRQRRWFLGVRWFLDQLLKTQRITPKNSNQ